MWNTGHVENDDGVLVAAPKLRLSELLHFGIIAPTSITATGPGYQRAMGYKTMVINGHKCGAVGYFYHDRLTKFEFRIYLDEVKSLFGEKVPVGKHSPENLYYKQWVEVRIGVLPESKFKHPKELMSIAKRKVTSPMIYKFDWGSIWTGFDHILGESLISFRYDLK